MANLNCDFPSPVRRAAHSALLSLTHPNKTMFERQRAMLRLSLIHI